MNVTKLVFHDKTKLAIDDKGQKIQFNVDEDPMISMICTVFIMLTSCMVSCVQTFGFVGKILILLWVTSKIEHLNIIVYSD